MAIWDGCPCHKLDFIRDQCLPGMFAPFEPMPWCSMSAEKLVGPNVIRERTRYPCLTCQTNQVTRQGIQCRACKKKEQAVQLCLP